MTWLHWYAGIGAVIMIAIMWYHFAYQPCKRSNLYHLFEALVLFLLWPLILVIGIVAGIARAREHAHDE